MNLITQLKEDGTAKGLCRPWRMKLQQGMSVEDLAALYIKGIDFCISEDYPTLDFLRDHFKGSCEPYGVFVDDEVKLSNAPDVVLNGDCKALLEYDGFAVSRIFARHNSQGAVNVSDNAYVTIDAFDNSNLVIAVAGSNAQVIVNLYGNAQVEVIGSGVEVHTHNKTYY